MMSRTRRIGRSLVVKFALSSFVILLLMIVASLVLFGHEGRAAAVERARDQALIVGDGIGSQQCAAALDPQGITTSVDLAPDIQIDERRERLLLAPAQEGLRSLFDVTGSFLRVTLPTAPATNVRQ